ncbi:hypothetical protein BC835DRAFT_754950 [Cytidiella melzeri]|nr:hypothetical protein BC835DRAFT_754950 [Cytidiella melzeri]
MATPAMQPVAAKASTAKALTINDLPVKIHEKIFGLWRGTPFTRSLRKTILSCSLTQRSWRRLAQQCWFYGLIVGRKDFENNKVDKFYLDDTQAEDIPAAANRDILQYVRMLAIGPLPSDSPTTTTADDDNDDNGDWMHSARFNAFIDRCGAGVKWLTVYQLRFKDYSHFVRFVRRFSVLQKLDFHACSWTEAEDPMEVDIDGSYPPIANLQSVALSDCNAAVTAKVGAWLTSETTCELPTLGWQVWLNHDVDGASNLFRALGSSLTRLVIGGIFARPRVVSPDSVYAASPWKQLGTCDSLSA